jgi:hypothetical protein
MTHPPLKKPAPPQGVIASLVTGFETVNARLELLLLPLALDLFLWLGPQLSIQPLVQRILATLDTPAGADAAALANLELYRSTLESFGANFNLLSVLSTAPLGLPSLLAGRAPEATPLGAPLVMQLEGFLVFLLLMGVFMLLGLLLGALYLGSIAQQVRDKRVSAARLVRLVWADWARLTALAMLALLVLVVLGVPVVLVTFAAMLLHPVLGGVVWLLGATVMLWTLFYGGFTVHGMLLHRRGLFGALWDSVRLVQVNLPQVAGLVLLIVLINTGLGLVWTMPATRSWFMLLGIGGHALVTTALVASTFVFYQDRYRWWIEMRRALRARAEAEAARRGADHQA